MQQIVTLPVYTYTATNYDYDGRTRTYLSLTPVEHQSTMHPAIQAIASTTTESVLVGRLVIRPASSVQRCETTEYNQDGAFFGYRAEGELHHLSLEAVLDLARNRKIPGLTFRGA